MNEPAAAKPCVLIVDDEKNIRAAAQLALAPEGLHVIAAHDAPAALRAVREHVVDVMILDIRLGDVDGLTLFRRIQADTPIPTIFISGQASLTEAAQAVRIGGFDFIEKPFSAEKLATVVRRCLEHLSLQERLRRIEALASVGQQIVGDSPAIRRVVAEMLRVAKTRATVLIIGESGTGKELVASALHDNSERAAAPFVKVNCSAIPDTLVESELFGHERGAFTGASNAKRGLFEMAHRGTIFLDEIGDLSAAAQAKILRVLQSGEVQKLGSEATLRVDVRVVSGTHKDLRQLVADGRFREDLYYRLNVVPIRVPALRERVEDVPLLARFFTAQLCAKNNVRQKLIDDEVLAELQLYRWPGNVRELQNAIERMVIMSGERITLLDLPEEIVAVEQPADAPGATSLKAFRDEAERNHILKVLQKNSGNVSQAALELGIRRTYLHRRMSQLGIDKRAIYGSGT
jgi:two-component system, NtrC family, nitrogen regulation response regulator NtrX